MGASKLFRQKGNHPSVLVAAMHPYRCSHFRNPKKECRCSPAQVEHYCAKISGPLLDRIDIHVEAPAVEFRDLSSNTPAEPSSAIRARVIAARERQSRRFARIKTTPTAAFPTAPSRSFAPSTPTAPPSWKKP